MEENRYYLPDWESGMKYPCTKEVYEDYMEFRDKILSPIFKEAMDKDFGQFLVFGTSGPFDSSSFEDVFYSPESYKVEQIFPTSLKAKVTLWNTEHSDSHMFVDDIEYDFKNDPNGRERK
jgi:hypothetical protein